MPHKRNPELSEHLVTLSRVVRANAGVALEAMIQEHERDGRAWKTEWVVLPEACLLTGAALSFAARLLDGLEVDTDAMAANVAARRGYVLSEPVLRALAERIGKHSAQQAVYEAALDGRDRDLDLAAALRAHPRIAAELTDEEITACLDPAAALGAAPAFVDRVVGADPVAALPRVPLATLPTPLHPARRLGEALGIELWFKRDDLTGFGLGGNKVRALEYLLADALARDCDCLVTGAGAQSNWAMLAALAARRCGLDPFLVRYGDPAAATGNQLLTDRIGAEVRYTGEPDRLSVDAGIDAVVAELTAAGRRPYRLPRGGATDLGSVGYVRASRELAGQLADARLTPSAVWLATGSCGTQAGLVAGARWLELAHQVVGVSVSRPAAECVSRVGELARGAARLLGLPEPGEDPVIVDGYLGPGYGLASPAGDRAARLAADLEGVFLDPVFGAKALAALADDARAGRVRGPVVFLVSGGAPTLFSGQAGAS